MKKTKVLLIYPHSSVGVFFKTKISIAVPIIPYISLASLAGALLKKDFSVKILDLTISENPEQDIKKTVKQFHPQFVGISFTSALSREAIEIAGQVKKIDKRITVIGGGVHTTTLPFDTLEKSPHFDIVAIGEGENTIVEIASGKNPKEIKGIAYRGKDNKIIINPRPSLIANLDDLPMPAWQLYNISKYHAPRITARKSPVGAMETSRGCPFGCCFCNKTVFARTFRAKSPDRVVNEMQRMLKMGFKEIHIWEDGFSTDIDRAKRICRLIIEQKMKFPWNLYNGIRVDRIDEELLRLLKKSGCYRISIGVESGNEQVLSKLGKNITKEKVRRAVKLTKKVGIECLGFFMFGLPGDTKQTMQDTIDFAKELNLDLFKAGILMPLPGTPVFEDWDKKGLIKSRDWSKYIFHDTNSPVYQHPTLTYQTIRSYYNDFYRSLYLSPRFILKRLIRGLKTGDIFFDAYYFIKTLPYGWFSNK